MTRTRSDLGPISAVVVGLLACAACCAGPLLALLAGVGVSSAIGAFWLPALAALAVASLAAVYWLRRRRTHACPVRPTTERTTTAMRPTD